MLLICDDLLYLIRIHSKVIEDSYSKRFNHDQKIDTPAIQNKKEKIFDNPSISIEIIWLNT